MNCEVDGESEAQLDTESWDTSIQNPADPSKKIWFLQDIPHVVKNLRSALCSGQEFELSHETVQKHGLPSKNVKLSHILQLVDFQEKNQFRLLVCILLKVYFLRKTNSMKVCLLENEFQEIGRQIAQQIDRRIVYEK